MTPVPSPRAALSHKGFRYYWIARLCATFAVQIVSVSVGWLVYDLTREPLMLGFVGLAQFLPSLLLVLVTGSVADRYNRRMIMSLCLIAEFMLAILLVVFVVTGTHDVVLIFAILTAYGIARAFFGPVIQSLVPNLVPREHLSNAIAWNSSSWQFATIVGPVAGGLLYGHAPLTAFGTAAILFLAGSICAAMIPKPTQKTVPEPASWSTVIAGFRYIGSNRIVLGAISLDLFAVLLGGAVALMPAYARDILDVGPWGLGLLRAGPGIGAIIVAVWLMFRPIHDHAGVLMFIGVALFGVATVVFGVSTNVWLSVFALIVMGAGDMVSVYVRETLIQLKTPDAVRGRVNAVNMVFIGASNELGEFRAGVSAWLIGVVPAVVFGGLGTIAVAAIWARAFPELRRARRLDGH